MKYSEIHRRFIKAGWIFNHAEGSHYFYLKEEILSEPIPYHGTKKMPKGMANKFIKRYGI